MKIQKPHFYRNLINGDRVSENVITEKDFDQWFNEMLANAVEVYGPQMYGNEFNGFVLPDTHKALLIHITEIKRETPADVLREILDDPDAALLPSHIERAKRALEVESDRK